MMTSDEAKEVLKAVVFIVPQEYYSDKIEEALDIANKALETVERIKARKRELEVKMHSSFSLTEATEHYVLTKLLREAEMEGNE